MISALPVQKLIFYRKMIICVRTIVLDLALMTVILVTIRILAQKVVKSVLRLALLAQVLAQDVRLV